MQSLQQGRTGTADLLQGQVVSGSEPRGVRVAGSLVLPDDFREAALDVLCGAHGDGLERAGGVDCGAGRQGAGVRDEQIGYVPGLVPLVRDGIFRRVAHAAGTHDVPARGGPSTPPIPVLALSMTVPAA